MESEKFICIREKPEGQAQGSISIVNMANTTQQPPRYPITADAAMMNPLRNAIALAQGQAIQLFDIDQKAKLAEANLSEPLVYWHWISATTIAIVTATSVYHWNVTGGAPKKMFDRMRELADSQIINYKADKNEAWLALIGISQRDGQVVGNIQLHSMEKGASQYIEGSAASFSSHLVQTPDGRTATKPSTLFVFAQKNAQSSKLFILEVSKGDDDKQFPRLAVEIFFPPDAAGDFPVSVITSDKYDLAYVITKNGYFHMYHLGNGTLIYRNRVSTETIFTTCAQTSTDGLIAVNRKGQVLALSVDEQNIVPYICQTLNDIPLGIRVAAKNNLPGAENLFTDQFNSLLASGQLKEAAAVAFKSPGTSLRNMQTVERVRQLPPVPGQPSPLIVYFGSMLEMGKLNQIESLELTRLVLQQNRLQLVERWVSEGKFECSEQMGDLIKQADPKLALQVYYLANAHGRVVQALAESGQQDKILPYMQKTGYSANMKDVLVGMIRTNPTSARTFASNLLQTEEGQKMDLSAIVDEFLRYNLVQDVTALLLEALKGDKPEQGNLQTRLLEVNLLQAPQVADAILGNDMFHHYNRQRIAQLCEQAGLYQRALEHYTEMTDIRRVVVHTNAINAEFLVSYFAQRGVDETLEVLQDLLRLNLRQNLPIVVQIATKYADQLTPTAVIQLFEKFKCYEGVFYFLGPLVNTSEDAEVIFKYIEAAAKVGHIAEVERICKESDKYEPAKVRDFLKEQKLQDQLPLIIVCDRFGFVEDLARYLYQNNMNKYIEAYVQKINSANTPAVVGALLDAGCNEEYIKALVISVRGGCPIDLLVEAVETRNRLKLILPWLEQRSQEGNPDAALHNAIAKCYVDMNKNPEEFLNENTFYDSRVVGKYCEDRDPYLAFVAYKRGKCDDELIQVTNGHALFKYQAKYLVERQDLDLWAKVLAPENEFKRQVVDQVVQCALPESKDPDHITTTVKAFMNANMPSELMELLEKIVLEGRHEFSSNKNLQNLLILTAVKADKTKVMDYVTRLDNYDAPDVANICANAELYEEAFFIFKKFKHNVAAIQILIEHIKDLARGKEFADKVNEPEVWSKLGKAQLDAVQVKDAVDSFLKANDHQYYIEVISAAETSGNFEDLVRYLQMCRKKIKESTVESELVFAFAKTNHMSDLEDFIATPNCAQIQTIGDRCFDEGLFEAAKILYTNINNFVRLASTLVKLKNWASAVDAARKANSTKTWREVTVACLDAKEFKLAQTAGLNIVVHGDELADVITQYERRGFFDEAIQLLEAGLPLERAHVGMFTELAVLYSKYREEKLMEFLKANAARMSPGRVLRVCRDNQQWKELTFIYISTNDFDHAIEVMIEHSVDAWDHVQFRDCLVKATRQDLFYRAVEFYLMEQPKRVNELLQSLVEKLDHAVVVERVRRRNYLALIKPYLVLVQENNVQAVNEALNELLIAEGDHESLLKSVDTYNAFDVAALAQKLENHEMLEFRRIASHLFTINKNFDRAIELSKKDSLYTDAMEVAALSGSAELAEGLVSFFVGLENKSFFIASLFVCYDLLRPDVVLELAWRNKIVDLVFPYMIQSIREHTERIAVLEKKNAEREKAEKDKSEKETKGGAFDAQSLQPEAAGFGLLALPPPPMPGVVPPVMPGMVQPGMVQPVMPGMVQPGLVNSAANMGLPPIPQSMGSGGFMGVSDM